MIEVTGLEKRFGQSVVLNDINLTITEGEVFGIVGHSGAGKSTLLRCFNGLEDYQAGSIRVIGQEVATLDAAGIRNLRRQMGMIFQTFNLLSSKNVFDNVALPMEMWHIDSATRKKRVLELLDLVGLADKRSERVGNLSGGQKQRIGIARALSLSPKILLCDEATSALDPRTTISILDLLLDIRRAMGLTIVFVTHQMEAVKRICDRIMFLQDGITQHIGPTDSLFLAPGKNLQKLIRDDYAVIPSGVNIRLWFPRDIARDAVVTSMARALDIDFSIVGGKLERFSDDVRGFLIINIDPKHQAAVVSYLRENGLFWEFVDHE